VGKGSQVYAAPAGTDLARWRSVVDLVPGVQRADLTRCARAAIGARSAPSLLFFPACGGYASANLTEWERKPMADPEIVALRAKLASRPRSADYRQRRRDLDALGLGYAVPSDVTVEPVAAGGVRAEWTSTPGDASDAAILYLHGGGYVIGSLDSHRHLVAAAGRAAGCWALALDYRLAPEHPFPAAVEDAVAGYRYLLGRGIKPGRVAIAGDSAGGGLVVAAMLAIREAGLPQPGCGWCISPWVDMEASGETMTSKSATDPTVQREGILDMARLYLNGADPRSKLAAPIYADLSGLAPLLIQVGAAETLLDDAIRLARLAGAADVYVDLQIWPEMVHVWHLFHPELTAGRQAIAAGGAFVRAHTSE
jgi:epsilon-lactone hydrolase